MGKSVLTISSIVQIFPPHIGAGVSAFDTVEEISFIDNYIKFLKPTSSVLVFTSWNKQEFVLRKKKNPEGWYCG